MIYYKTHIHPPCLSRQPPKAKSPLLPNPTAMLTFAPSLGVRRTVGNAAESTPFEPDMFYDSEGKRCQWMTDPMARVNGGSKQARLLSPKPKGQSLLFLLAPFGLCYKRIFYADGYASNFPRPSRHARASAPCPQHHQLRGHE